MTTPLNDKQLAAEFRKQECERMKKLAWLRLKQLVCGAIFVVLGCIAGVIAIMAYKLFADISNVTGWRVLANFAGGLGLLWLVIGLTSSIGRYIHVKIVYWKKGVQKSREKRKETDNRSEKGNH